ncbi:hypothetical protein PGTUg99_037048 [Puccinia graminis f. sp. tritici]|uniref:Uncharacterized protein n=1 Tax=Puccinia graminis f. sp. tritici TaxID=56615 RepID=A0A5B0MJM7_PUCGR|nr:hypothetical protein PGTUg99_037048 [Puccinia graminis f. sp. tritici]
MNQRSTRRSSAPLPSSHQRKNCTPSPVRRGNSSLLYTGLFLPSSGPADVPTILRVVRVGATGQKERGKTPAPDPHSASLGSTRLAASGFAMTLKHSSDIKVIQLQLRTYVHP